MKKYALYTEYKPNVESLTSHFFEGFTLSKTTGFWKGTKEDSVKIEIFTADQVRVQELAQAIKSINAQESVLIEFPNGDGVLA